MRQKPNRVWLILLVGVALLTIAGIARLNMGRDRIAWRDDFAAAARESELTHKPLFLDFTAVWCEPCQQLKHSTWADAGVARALASYVPVRIDVDAHPDLAARYGAIHIPTFFTLDSARQPTRTSEGYLDADEFIDWLQSKPN